LFRESNNETNSFNNEQINIKVTYYSKWPAVYNKLDKATLLHSMAL